MEAGASIGQLSSRGNDILTFGEVRLHLETQWDSYGRVELQSYSSGGWRKRSPDLSGAQVIPEARVQWERSPAEYSNLAPVLDRALKLSSALFP